MALAGITATAIYVGVPWDAASAQNSSMSNTPAATLAAGSPVSPPLASAAQAPALSYGVGEVVKMYKGGVGKDTIISYIQSTFLPYHVDAAGIHYLQSLGIPQDITQAMIQRDAQLMQQSVPQPSPGPNAAAAAQVPGPVVTPSTPPPDITVIGSDDGYDYPYYDYGDYGPPVFYGGWGWGNGWGYGGFHRDFGRFHGGGGRGFRGGWGGGGFHGGGFRGGGGGGFHGGGGGGHGGGGHR